MARALLYIGKIRTMKVLNVFTDGVFNVGYQVVVNSEDTGDAMMAAEKIVDRLRIKTTNNLNRELRRKTQLLFTSLGDCEFDYYDMNETLRSAKIEVNHFPIGYVVSDCELIDKVK